MYPRVRETGRRLQHDSSNHIPLFRHPYEKYSYSSRNCIYRDSGIYKQTFERNESPESFADNFRTPRRGLEERNNLICQTFLTENPFFGAYYPALRPRSLGADGVSGKGSDRARSISPDFDDSKTYKITTYSCDSRCSEEYSAKSKKDDVHHFHEHHHFFHDKSSDNSDSSYPFNKTVVESAPSPFARPKKCYLSYAARESRMVHRLFRDVPQRNERGVNETSNEGFRLMSRGSSRSGRKSSDNETYTVMCKRCQKFPRDPGARVIDEERIIKQWNRGCDVTVSRRSHIDSAQVLIAQCSSHNQTEKVRLSRERVQSEKREKTRKNSSADNSGRPTKSSVLKKHHSGGSEKKTLNDTDKVRRSDAANLDHRSIILKCDHCSNVLEKCPKEIGLLQSIDVEKKITDVSKKGTSVGHGTEKRSSATKRPIVVDERKSRNVKESRERTKPGKSVRRRASGHSDKSKTSVRGASRAAERTVPSHCYSEESDRSSDPKEPIRKRRSSSYNALKNAAASEKKHAGRGERRTVSEVRKRSESAQMPSRERSRTRKRVDVGCETPRNTESGPLREFKDRKSTRTKEGKESASHKQPLKTNVSPYRLRDQSVEVGRDRKVGTEGHKPTETGKTARRTIIIRTEERSMQTSDGNLMDGKGHPPRRSTTASKNAYKTTVADPRRSGTAPGGLVSRSFPSDKAKNYGVRGSTMLSRRTVASKNSPVTRPGPFQEPKANEGLTDIGSKITDLESHLEKLEAMHSPRGKRTEPAIPQARDPADRRKQPIVVCTSTTYIMTKCSNPCGDRRDPEEPPEGKIVKREERQSPPPRLSPGDGDKKTTGEHSQTQYCHFVWPKITRALNRLGPRPETGYCDYGSSYDPLFKTGKPRVLASAEVDCCDLGGTRGEGCPWNHAVRVAGSLLRSYSDNVHGSARLISFRSYTAITKEIRRPRRKRMARKRLLRCGITPPALPKSEVQIDESLRRGHILRTSMSDICEYKNGSLIRLYGKSGWTLYTRKLFLTGLDLNMPCKGPGGLQYFTVYPARTEVNSRSFVGVTINNGFLEANRYLTATRYIPRSGKSPSNIYLVRDGIFGPGNPDLSEPEMRRRREREIFPDDSLALRQQTIINRNVKWEVDSQNRFCTCRRGTKRKTQENAARMPYERQKSSAVLFVFENVNSKPSEPSTEGDNSKGHHSEVTRRGTFHDRPSKTRASRQIENDGLTDLLRTLGRENDDVELIEREIRSEYGDYEDNLPKHCSGRHSAAYQGDKRRSTIPLKRSAVGENISMKDIGRKTRWLRTDNVNPIERNEPKQVKGRCACCHCRSNHVCRPHVPEEPVTGLQKILRNIAFTGWNLGTKKPVSRTSSKKSVKKRDERDGTPETVEDGPSSHRKITSMDRKIPPGADVLDDISIQRHRLTECENLLRQFELKLDDVTRQSEAYSCRCDGADVRPRHDSVCRCPDSEGRDQEESSRRYGDHSDSKNEPGPCRCEEKENTVSRYVTTRGHASDSHRQQMKAVPSSNSAHHHTSSLNPVSSSNAAHHGGPGIISLPPRIEIISERTACTCEKCRNIHYIEKHYLPTALIKNALKQDSRSQAQQDTHWDREKDRDRDREREIEQRWSQKIKTPPKKLKNRTMSTLDQYTEEKYAQADDSWDALDDGRRNSGDSYRSFTGDPSKKGKIKSCMCSSQLRAIEDRLKALEQRRHESSRDRTSEDIASLSELSRKKSSSDRYTTVTSTSSVKTNSKTNSTMKYSSSPSEHSPPHHAPSPPTPPRKAKKEDKKKDGKKEDKKFKGKKKEEKKEKKEKEKKEKKKKGKKDKKDKTRKVASLEAIRSETDVEVRTLVVSCQNMGMFEKGDPTAKSTCRCMEGKYCPFKYFGADDPGIQKNIFFLTNLDLPARWSRLYGPMNYEYCKTSSYLANRRLKSEKRRESPRDWHNVRAALASFLRSLRLRKRKIFHRRKKMECIGESCSRIGSDSEDSLLNDCSRSSMPLQKRSFHISLDGPRPIRPTKEKWRTSSKRRTPSEKKRRKKSRKKRV